MHSSKWILASVLLFFVVSCTTLHTIGEATDDSGPSFTPSQPSCAVAFTATDNPVEFEVSIDSKQVGLHSNHRQAERVCGYLNADRTWLVVEDGCGGDSYPNVTVYMVIGGRLKKSQELVRIEAEHYQEYRKGSGATDPAFLGFDSAGFPVMRSATGTHTLHR